MTKIVPVYGVTTAMTITLASLAYQNVMQFGRQSTVVDNSIIDADDFLIGGKITQGATVTAQRMFEVWAFASYDDTEYGGSVPGDVDAAFAPGIEKFSMRLLQVIQNDGVANKSFRWGPCSLAAAFDGEMPEKWGIWIAHNSGGPLHSTAANHELYYTPVNYEAVP